jgi:hypothetical protein
MKVVNNILEEYITSYLQGRWYSEDGGDEFF